MAQRKQPQTGDYVLATLTPDGASCEDWCVGTVKGILGNRRYDVVDDNGVSHRYNGYMKATVISRTQGARLMELKESLKNNYSVSMYRVLGGLKNLR